MSNKLLTTLLSLALVFISPLTTATEHTERFNRVTFTTTAETEVANDLLVVMMSAQAQGDDLQNLADEVNRNMNWAIGQAKKPAGIRYQTLNYATSPRYEKGRQNGWQVSQTLKISGTDAAGIARLMGKLQEKLQTQSVSYQVTPETREATEKKLTTEALQKFTRRAGDITATLQMKNYRLVALNVDSGHTPQPRPMMAMSRMVMADAAVAPPSIEAGSQTVSVSVTGTIEIEP